MKLRKLMAASMAAAVAACAVSVTSFAGFTNYADGYTLDAIAEGYDITEIYGFTVTFSGDTAECGGGFGLNSPSTGWKSIEWGNVGSGKAVEIAEDNTATFWSDAPCFVETDATDPANPYAQIWVQHWWGNDLTIEDVTVLGADGEELVIGGEDTDAPAEEAPVQINASNSPYTIMEGEAAIDMTKLTANIDLITDNANVNWNAWCNSTIAVTVNDVTEYFVFAGTQVSWDVTLNADTEDEVVIAPADFAAMADEGSIAVEMPVDISAGDDVTVEIIAQCWLDDTTGESAFAFTSLEIEEGEADGGDVEIDVWESYDLDAATAANEAFVFGTDTNIDLYALVGDSWADLAKIDATFVWTPGLGGWCGGAGLGNGAVLEDGTNWISGPEYGAANANSAVEPDGTATQTIIDITGTPLADIVAVAEDGTVSYAQLQVQNWWNGVEAGAKLAALTAYDADGNVIGEITYDVEIPGGDASQDTDAPTDDKQSPDTGVEGIAAIAGVVALAGAAVVISRKRK